MNRLLAAPASATTVFSTDFESGLPAAFSGAGALTGVQGYAGIAGISGQFLRNDGFGATTITLTDLAPHTQLTLTFAPALIDSWDGTGASDFFNITVDGVEVYEASVDHQAAQTDELIPAGSTLELQNTNIFNVGGTTWNDHAILATLTIAHSGAGATISLFADGSGYQGGTDESWAIDNFTVESDAVSAVPLPAAAPLLVAGLAGLAALRRRG